MTETETAYRSNLLSIVVPCRNEVTHIGPFLDNMINQKVDGCDMEILVADGMSDDGTREIIRSTAERHSNVKLLDNPAGFVSPGLNLAIRNARGAVILRADVHTRYAPDYVAQCVKALEETGADNVGGAARTTALTGLPKAIAMAYSSPYSVGGARFHEEDFEGWVDTVPYGCWRAEFFERVGFFDEDLIRNQDDELNFRAVRCGNGVWQSRQIQSWYEPRSTLRSLFKQYLQYGYWKVLVIRKHRRAAAIRHWVPFSALLLGTLLLGFGLMLPAAWNILAAIFCLYLLLLLIGSVHICTKSGSWASFRYLPFALAAFHFGYGIGFALGVIDFVVFRRSGAGLMRALTR